MAGRSSEDKRRTELMAPLSVWRIVSRCSWSTPRPSFMRVPSHSKLSLSPVSCWPRSSCSSREMRVRSSSRTVCWSTYKARNCEFMNCSSSLARRCSVTSRSTAVICSLPPISVLEMDDSIGNSLPSRRWPKISSCPAMERGLSSDLPNASANASWRGRACAGINRASGWPTASACEKPNMASAAGLNRQIVIVSSTATMASLTDSTVCR